MEAHRFLLAPNAFKGSLSAFTFCSVLSRALEEKGFRALSLPLGDGGDGTAEIVAHYAGTAPVEAETVDALGRPHPARYHMRGRTAVIELAEACGIKLLKRREYDILNAGTRGFGALIDHALRRGAREFVLCVGGSASVDGGLGALAEMGLGVETAGGAGNPLVGLAAIDPAPLRERFREAQFTVLCDVDNPLVGPAGAAAVFGPQKGASPEQIPMLDSLLRRYARLLRGATGRDTCDLPMGGAAGGVAAAFSALLDARLVSGSDYCLTLARFDERLAEAEAVVTGEGRLDAQSLRGKIPGTVARRCRTRSVPVYAVVGSAEAETLPCFDGVFTLSDYAPSAADSIRNAPAYLRLVAGPLADAFYAAYY